MNRHDEQALLEAVRIHRGRLRGAFLQGTSGVRRGVATLTGRLMWSLVIAAVVCAICVGVSFAISVIPQMSPAPMPTSSPSSAATAPAGLTTVVLTPIEERP